MATKELDQKIKLVLARKTTEIASAGAYSSPPSPSPHSMVRFVHGMEMETLHAAPANSRYAGTRRHTCIALVLAISSSAGAKALEASGVIGACPFFT